MSVILEGFKEADLFWTRGFSPPRPKTFNPRLEPRRGTDTDEGAMNTLDPKKGREASTK